MGSSKKLFYARAAAILCMLFCMPLCPSFYAGAVLPEPATESGELGEPAVSETAAPAKKSASKTTKTPKNESDLQDILPEPATAKADDSFAAPRSFGDAASSDKLPPSGAAGTGVLYFESEQTGIYRYSLPGGLGFDSSVIAGGTADGVVAIQIDDSPDLAWVFYRDGKSYDYQTGVTDPRSAVFIESGLYELFISDGVSTDKFSFTIAESDIAGGLADSISGMMSVGNSAIEADTTLDMEYTDSLYRFTFPGMETAESDIAGSDGSEDSEGSSVLGISAEKMGVTANLPVGALTNGTLKLTADNGIEVTAYRDGEPLEWNNGDVLYDDGVYNFKLTPLFTIQTGVDSRGNPIRVKLTSVVSFRIVTRPTSVLDCVTAPAGFSIDRVYVRDAQGEHEVSTDGQQVFPSTDGYYAFQFRSLFSTDADFSVTALRDTAPPELALPAEVLNGQPYKGKVTLRVKPTQSYKAGGRYIISNDTVESDTDSNVNITVMKDKQIILMSDRTLISPGTYTVYVTDSADNYNTYTIEIYGKAPINLDIPILLLSVLAVPALWLFIHRKERMRVI